MQVVVKPGACLIEGATGYETESRTMVVQAAGSTDRIDSVVLRLNDNIDFRDIDLYVVKGNSSTEPPQLTRTGGIYEIGLANLYVSANSSTITTERITDTRLVTARCGYAMPVQEFDTTALFDQLQAQVNENIELIQRAINQTEAAHLQEQIDSISSDIGTESIAGISDGTLKGAVAKHEQDVNSLNLNLANIIDKLYPVGSIYLETTNTNPSAKLGGEWTAYGSSDSYLRLGGSGSGGSNSVTLAANQIPSLRGSTSSAGTHTHTLTELAWVNNPGAGVDGNFYHMPSGSGYYYRDRYVTTNSTGAHTHSVSITNNSQKSVTIAPKYVAVYAWKRIK